MNYFENLINLILYENIRNYDDIKKLKKLYRIQQNKKPTDIIADFLVKHKLQNVFISFRSGVYPSRINVRTRFNTPAALYTYPAIPLLKKSGLSNTKDIRDMHEKQFFSSRIFPWAVDSEFIYIFHISDTSNMLYTSKDESEKIRNYVNKIKEIYNDNVKVQNICDNYLATNKQYSNFLGTSKSGLWGFWLMIYAIGEVLRTHKKLSNFFTYLVNRLGIVGFVDDASIGMIHKNEPLQAVFFFGVEKYIDDEKYISRSKGLDYQIPRNQPLVKGKYDPYSNRNKNLNEKLKNFLEKSYKIKIDSLIGIDYRYLMLNQLPVPLINGMTNKLIFFDINPYEKKYKLLKKEEVNIEKYSKDVINIIKIYN